MEDLGNPLNTAYTVLNVTKRLEEGYSVQEAIQYKRGWIVGRTKEARTLEAARALIPNGKVMRERSTVSHLDVVEWWF